MSTEEKKVVVVVSGGMDSTTLLHKAVKEKGSKNVIALTFNYGSRHNHKEIPFAKEQADILGVKHILVDLRDIFKHFKSALLKHEDSESIPEGFYVESNMRKTVVPFRNGILISIAGGLAESEGFNTVYYGAHGGDHHIYPDCRTSFHQVLDRAVALGTYNSVRVEAPYTGKSKSFILKEGLMMGVDYSKTWTCYDPTQDGLACGRCGACIERLEAFDVNSETDPIKYNLNK